MAFSDPNSQLCGRVFHIGETVYSCRDCATRSGNLLCRDCFQSGIHKHHHHLTRVCSGPGWFCDCGDVTAWETGPCCPKHSSRARGSNSQLCRRYFMTGETMYSCRDCATDPHSLLCRDCFQSGIHKHHSYETQVCPGRGWFCDCGDVKAWETGSCCSKHSSGRSAFMTTARAPKSQVCGRYIMIGETIYSCRECATKPGNLFCQDCFRSSIHKHHHYETQACPGLGWYCDCGVLKAWETGPCCSKHSPVVSEELQRLELREVARAVTGPLKSTVCSFNNVLEILLTNADGVPPECKTVDDIKQHIENMKLQMRESEQVARKEIQRLDEAADELTAEQKDLVKQRKKGERELGDLKTQLRSYNSSLQRYREALEKEMRDLKVAEDNLDRVRQRKDKTRTVQDEQSTDIPFWGLLAGAVLAGVMNMNLDSDNVDNIEEMNNCEPVRFGKVSEYWSSICQAQRRLHETDDKIHETEAKLQWASEKQEVVGDVQATTRKALQRLQLLRGVENIAELRTQQLDLLGPVMKVMEEMAAALGQITGDDLLHKEGIKGLIWDMRKNWFSAEQLVDGSRDIGEDE